MASLVPEPILIPAVRALPGDGIAGHAPDVFIHTFLADVETAPALPAKTKFLAAAVAQKTSLLSAFAPVGGAWCGFFHGCCFIRLLI